MTIAAAVCNAVHKSKPKNTADLLVLIHNHAPLFILFFDRGCAAMFQDFSGLFCSIENKVLSVAAADPEDKEAWNMLMSLLTTISADFKEAFEYLYTSKDKPVH
jgi:hypothetical protein